MNQLLALLPSENTSMNLTENNSSNTRSIQSKLKYLLQDLEHSSDVSLSQLNIPPTVSNCI